jgi:hypothetical protein
MCWRVEEASTAWDLHGVGKLQNHTDLLFSALCFQFLPLAIPGDSEVDSFGKWVICSLWLGAFRHCPFPPNTPPPTGRTSIETEWLTRAWCFQTLPPCRWLPVYMEAPSTSLCIVEHSFQNTGFSSHFCQNHSHCPGLMLSCTGCLLGWWREEALGTCIYEISDSLNSLRAGPYREVQKAFSSHSTQFRTQVTSCLGCKCV